MENIIANIVAGGILCGMWTAVACMAGAIAWGVAEMVRGSR
jgi:hypothetical protein